MTLDYNINNNTDKNYNLKDNKYNIWLVNKQGDIFIKNLSTTCKLLSVESFTITAPDKLVLIGRASNEWNLDKISTIKKIYSFNSRLAKSKIKINGYIINPHLNLKQQSLISKKCNGEFINYRNIERKFSKYEKDPVFIEAYCELLTYLDNEFGWFNHLTIKKKGVSMKFNSNKI